MQSRITVIGSINMDLVAEASRRPEAGETILGSKFSTIPGGKGANQAVAAARLGGNVTMIGCVGDDAFGSTLRHNLKEEGINVDHVNTVTDTKTGIASITLADNDNSIVVVPGANNEVTEEMMLQYEDVIAGSDIVLLQLEIPLPTVVKAAELARRHGVSVILNPAPIQKLPDELIDYSTYLTPNEHEYDALMKDYTGDANALRQKLVITQGGDGTIFYEKAKDVHVPGYSVDVADTTGAGDCFNGGLAVQLAKGASLQESCRYANAAGALSVTKFGAQSGMPTDQEVNKLLSEKR